VVFPQSLTEASRGGAWARPSLVPVSNRNAAAIGLLGGRLPCCPRSVGAAGYRQAGSETSVAKSSKTSNGLLTVWSCGDYIRLTNEGGSPLATKKFAS